MNWKLLTTAEELEEIKTRPTETPQLIFKHSTRCPISSMAKNRLDRAAAPDNVDFYLLDLLKYRPVSSKVEDEFKVAHESPQVLIIRDSKCVYDESHNAISMDDILQHAKA